MCPICLDTMSDAFRTLPCGHKYHEVCIQKWKDACSIPQCPLCRRSFATHDGDWKKYVRTVQTAEGLREIDDD